MNNIIFKVILLKGEAGQTIRSIENSGTEGNQDLFTVTLNDGTTSTFYVDHGRGITSIEKTSTEGLVDTYTITYTDDTTSTFDITNCSPENVASFTEQLEELSVFVTPEMYGAVGDGETDDTEAIQSAFDSGSIVIFDSEKTYATQMLQIKSNAYINFNGCTLKMIGEKYRLLEIYEIPNVTIENVTMLDSGSWTYTEANYGGFIRAIGCDYLMINNVKVLNKYARYQETPQHTAWTFTLSGDYITVKDCYIDSYDMGAWGDGIHIGYSNNCEIYGCTVLAGDDAIAIAPTYYMNTSGLPNDLEFDSACKDDIMTNINIHDCVLSSAVANALRLGIGVNTSTDYSQYAIENLKFHDNIILNCKNFIELNDIRTDVQNTYSNLEFYNNIIKSEGYYTDLNETTWVDGMYNLLYITETTIEAKIDKIYFNNNLIEPLQIRSRLILDTQSCAEKIVVKSNIINTYFSKIAMFLYSGVSYIFEDNKITRKDGRTTTDSYSFFGISTETEEINLVMLGNEVNDEFGTTRFSPVFANGNFTIKDNVFNTSNTEFVWCFKGDSIAIIDGNTFNNTENSTLGIIYYSTPTTENVSSIIVTRNLVLNQQLALFKVYYDSTAWIKAKKIIISGNSIPECDYLTTVNSLGVPITNYTLANTVVVS